MGGNIHRSILKKRKITRFEKMFPRASIRLLIMVGAVLHAVESIHLTAEDKKTITDVHNDFRRTTNPTASNMMKMEWSDELAATAQQWADTCEWEHNPDRSRNSPSFNYVGENKYINTGATKFERMVEFWSTEMYNYNFENDICTLGICTHWTQVVWHNSNHVGCGFKYCPSFIGLHGWSGYYHVCNYGPGGNDAGENPYTEGPACTNCPSSAPYCDNGLCTKEKNGGN